MHQTLFKTPKRVLFAGTFLRLFLILYAAAQDFFLEFPYTDIDFAVMSDGASLMLEGKSPYLRHTFRYPPAMAIVFFVTKFHPIFGKLMLVFLDYCAAKMLMALLEKIPMKTSDRSLAFALYYLNPVVLQVSTRGSPECLTIFLVFSVLYFIDRSDIFIAAICYGFLVHLRIYPVIFAPSIFIYFMRSSQFKKIAKFIVISLSTLIGFTCIFYLIYGYDFLEHSYLYHLSRIDHRHNFSVFFPYMALTLMSPIEDDPNRGLLVLTILQAFAAGVPSLLLLKGKQKTTRQLAHVFFLQTLIFVTMNKVVTAQYFTWWIALLPFAVVPALWEKEKFNFTCFNGIVFLLTMWIGAEVRLVYCQYALEFKVINVFKELWLSSIFFFFSNVCVFLWFAIFYI